MKAIHVNPFIMDHRVSQRRPLAIARGTLRPGDDEGSGLTESEPLRINRREIPSLFSGYYVYILPTAGDFRGSVPSGKGGGL